MKAIFKELLIKNFLLVTILAMTLLSVKASIGNLKDLSQAGNLLVVASILAVTACFGNFAFTYERIEISNTLSRIWAHTTTGLLMLVLGISLQMSYVLSGMIVGRVPVLDMSWALLYLASIMYDFWDLRRAEI